MTEREFEIAYRETYGFMSFGEWRRTAGSGLTDVQAFNRYNAYVRECATANGLVD